MQNIQRMQSTQSTQDFHLCTNCMVTMRHEFDRGNYSLRNEAGNLHFSYELWHCLKCGSRVPIPYTWKETLPVGYQQPNGTYNPVREDEPADITNGSRFLTNEQAHDVWTQKNDHPEIPFIKNLQGAL